MLFESDEPNDPKTYPGRKLVQAAQVGLVIAIVVFGVMSLASFLRPSESDRLVPPLVPTVDVAVFAPTTTPKVMPTEIPEDGAAALYERALAIHDVSPAEAIGLYTQVLELDPTMANAWLGRAVAYAETGKNLPLSRSDFWRYVQAMETGRIEETITANRSLNLKMDEGAFMRSFKAEAGDQIDITATSAVKGEAGDENVVDPLILLFDPSSHLLDVDDDTLSNGTLVNMDSHIEAYKVTKDGTYSLLVTHAGGGSQGDLDVDVSVR